jgi:hypothetical protein
MATIEKRVSGDGIVTYRVKIRLKGSRHQNNAAKSRDYTLRLVILFCFHRITRSFVPHLFS